jgi:hypothetical protein
MKEDAISDPVLITAATGEQQAVCHFVTVLCTKGGGITIWNSTTSAESDRGEVLMAFGDRGIDG